MRFGKFLDKCHTIVFHHWNFIQIVFIFLYALEQIALILLIHVNAYSKTLIVSLFAVVVLTTFAIHELLMKIRMRAFENKVYALQLEKQSLIRELQIIRDMHVNRKVKVNGDKTG